MFRAAVAALLFFVALGASEEFDRFMGKNTPHWTENWECVKDEKERAFFEKCSRLYDKNRDLRFTQTGPFKIPKVVHFIWLGPRAFPPGSVENVRTWIAQNPDWTVKFWTDRDRDPPCSSMEKIVIKEFPYPHLGKRYAESENWGEKSDILRFEILYDEGGVYVDHDANCLRSFDGLHRGYDFYCCLEMPHPMVAGFHITAGIGVLGSRPHHPVVGKVIEMIESRWEGLAKKYPEKDGFSKTQLVMERTYLALTDALKEGWNEGEDKNIFLPAAYFFAKGGVQPLYSKHFFANSWANEEGNTRSFEEKTKKNLIKIDRKIKTLVFYSVAILSFNLVLIAIWMRKKT